MAWEQRAAIFLKAARIDTGSLGNNDCQSKMFIRQKLMLLVD
jgi:hypothetical protein